MAQEIVVTYVSESKWFLGKDTTVWDEPLPFELKDVHDWFIKYDILTVQHTPDSEWVRYEPHYTVVEGHDFKRPDKLYVDGVEIS